MNNNYAFYPKLILRAPALPFQSEVSISIIKAYLQNKDFQEALFLASPGIHAKCKAWLQGEITNFKEEQKLIVTLVKYYSRMFSRCTPFGLFASCTVLNWGDVSHITFDPERRYQHTRLDMYYLCALAQHLAKMPFIKERLKYYPNNSIYTVCGEVRYIEYQYINGERNHQISAVATSPYLEKVLTLCEKGLTPVAITTAIVDEDINKETAQEFVNELIEAQLLVSELDPAVTGQEFIYQILLVLERIYEQDNLETLGQIIKLLKNTEGLLRELGKSTSVNMVNYQKVIAGLEKFGIPFESNKLFQTDYIRSVSGASVSRQYQQQLLESFQVLQYLTPPNNPDQLNRFIQQFYGRYEDKEMPLLQVLDAESGIGYAANNDKGNAPLVEDLNLNEVPSEVITFKRTEAFQLLYKKIRAAEKKGQHTVTLEEAEIKNLPQPNFNLPPSLSVTFKIVDAKKLYIESFSGSSAANLLGRFAHANTQINKAITEIAASEQQQNPDVLFAEIVHLPEKRVGNILLRPVFRQYEIPYLTHSALHPKNQIKLQDLYISIKNGQIVLRSKKLNKVIVPRLSTAHNYTYQSMPIYHFLCDLQHQGLQPHLSLQLDHKQFGTSFLPRICYKDIILYPASWQLTKGDVQVLIRSNKQERASNIEKFKKQWDIPRYFTLVDGDRELLVDIENELMVTAWLETIKHRKIINLREFLFDPSENPVRDLHENAYTNQFIAALIKKKTCYQVPDFLLQKQDKQVVREFSLGSEWLYYKFYCGVEMADKILIEVIKPLVQQLKSEVLVDQWFFIRYADPHHHLRIRFHLKDTSKIGEVILHIREYISPYEAENIIWQSQTATYYRELDRYGNYAITQTEALFSEDSSRVLTLLEEFAFSDDNADLRWLSSLGIANILLDIFDYDLQAKLVLMEKLKTSFAKEFNMNKALKLQIDKKYRHYRPQIVALFTGNPSDLFNLNAMCKSYQQLKPLAQKLIKVHTANNQSADTIVGSFIHMHLNRLIASNQRLHELLIYDFLFRNYQSQLAIQKKGTTSSPP
ncbi:MAG: lantibiotic dehydratase [Bacteroidota bacterium]